MKINKTSIFTTSIAIIASATLFATPTFASTGSTVVRGNVYDQSTGYGINGLTVSVNCNGHVQTSQTGLQYQGHDAGEYQINYNAADCGPNNPVVVSVTHNSQSLTDNRNVSTDLQYNGNSFEATADFYFGPSVSVPEFSTLTGLIALVGSLGTLYFLRKRNFSN